MMRRIQNVEAMGAILNLNRVSEQAALMAVRPESDVQLCLQIGATPTMERLLACIEEVQALDIGSAHVMVDATSLDAGGQQRTNLLGQLRRDLLAQEAGNPIRIGGKHGLARDRAIQWYRDLFFAKNQVGGVFGLTDAPVVDLPEHIKNGAQPVRVAGTWQRPVMMIRSK